MENNDFTLKKITDLQDFEEAIEANGRIYVTWKKRLFCKDIFRELLVEWVEDHWEERPYSTLPESEEEAVDDEKALAYVRGVKPWGEFHKILARLGEEEKAKRLQEMALTSRRVLGWTSQPFHGDAFLLGDDLNEEEWAALVSDVMAHDYLFAGEDHQESEEAVYPVLDDYRYHQLSRRGFGALMAEAHGDFSEFGYARYTESCLIEDKDRAFPNGGKTIEEENPPYSFEVTEEFLDSFIEWNKDHNPCYMVLPLGKGFYWLKDLVSLTYGNKKWSGTIEALHLFHSKEELLGKYEGYEDYEIPYREEDTQGEYPRLFALVKDADEERYKPYERYFYDNNEKTLLCCAFPGMTFYAFDDKEKAWHKTPYSSDYYEGLWGFHEKDPNRFVLVGEKAERVNDPRFKEAVSLFQR